MMPRRKQQLAVPLLALSMTLALAASAHAQDYPNRRATGTSFSLQVSLGSTPHWAGIRGTRVEELPQGEGPGYDMFRYDGNYYVYDNDRWFSSRNDRGQFNMIDESSVPSEFSKVPRDHWHHYPSRWTESNNYDRDQSYRRPATTLMVRFASTPRWSYIRGTNVQDIRTVDRPDYDMFRYGGTYYAFNDNQWYSSRRSSGRFMAIDARFVPRELSRVPRERWHNYPQGWVDTNHTPRYRRHAQRY